ncbi:antitoxin [Streptomyces sp. NPDC001118]|uniref:antitoxin n=1 Tax=unclassified Streptomyces TaxID=2593676 RepID=UPI0033329E55
MSVMDKLKQMLRGHEDQAKTGVDKAGDAIDERTQGTYRSQVDTAQQKTDEFIDQNRQDNPPQ